MAVPHLMLYHIILYLKSIEWSYMVKEGMLAAIFLLADIHLPIIWCYSLLKRVLSTQLEMGQTTYFTCKTVVI